MRILMTGHSGFLGSVMAPVLQSSGHEIVGLDCGFFEGCTFGMVPDGIVSLRKDIRDVAFEDVSGFDAIVHLAALSNDPLGNLRPEWTFEINHEASVILARLAREAGIRRFVYASSCSIYGAAGDEVRTEEASLDPLTPYAISKARTEEDISRLEDDSFSPVFMRNATAFGVSPRLRVDLVLNNLVGWAYTTGKVRILSDGTSWRPIVHAQDISRAFAAVLAAPREAIHDQKFNVGVNSENYRVRDLAEIVQRVVPGCIVEYAGQSGPDPRTYRVDFSKIARVLPDFKPEWNAHRGAEELYSSYRQHGLTREDFEGRKYVRLKQLEHLLAHGLLDDSLRWNSA